MSESHPDSPTRSEMPRLISVDDHVVEPPNIWQDRLPERYKAGFSSHKGSKLIAGVRPEHLDMKIDGPSGSTDGTVHRTGANTAVGLAAGASRTLGDGSEFATSNNRY